jgi:Uma2 family endonuclease
MVPTANSVACLRLPYNGSFKQAAVFAKESSFLPPVMANPPGHQAIALKIAAILLRYAETTQAGRVFHAPCNVLLSRNIVVQPDILFVRRCRQGIIGKNRLFGTPDLVVEILSRNDGTKYPLKKSIYSQFGIQELWTADPTHNMVETWIWSEAGYVCTGRYGKSDRVVSYTLPNLKLPISSIFYESAQ